MDIVFVDCDTQQAKMIAEFFANTFREDYARQLKEDPQGKRPEPPPSARARKGVTAAQRANEVAFEVVPPRKPNGTVPPGSSLLD